MKTRIDSGGWLSASLKVKQRSQTKTFYYKIKAREWYPDPAGGHRRPEHMIGFESGLDKADESDGAERSWIRFWYQWNAHRMKGEKTALDL